MGKWETKNKFKLGDEVFGFDPVFNIVHGCFFTERLTTI